MYNTKKTKKMKQKYLSFLFTLLMNMVTSVALAQSFEADGIYYVITSTTEFTVKVTMPEFDYDSVYENSSYNTIYTGEIIIPESVVYNGKTYKVTSIDAGAFYDCRGVNSVTIPNSVTAIYPDAFWECRPASVTVRWNTPIDISFSNLSGRILYVPYGTKEAYESAPSWGIYFEKLIEGPRTCATPQLSYVNGQIRCSCETEGVKYLYSISPVERTGESTDGIIELGTTFRVKVRATHEDHVDSEEASIIVNLEQVGDLNGDGTISVADITALVNVVLGK